MPQNHYSFLILISQVNSCRVFVMPLILSSTCRLAFLLFYKPFPLRSQILIVYSLWYRKEAGHASNSVRLLKRVWFDWPWGSLTRVQEYDIIVWRYQMGALLYIGANTSCCLSRWTVWLSACDLGSPAGLIPRTYSLFYPNKLFSHPYDRGGE